MLVRWIGLNYSFLLDIHHRHFLGAIKDRNHHFFILRLRKLSIKRLKKHHVTGVAGGSPPQPELPNIFIKKVSRKTFTLWVNQTLFVPSEERCFILSINSNTHIKLHYHIWWFSCRFHLGIHVLSTKFSPEYYGKYKQYERLHTQKLAKKWLDSVPSFAPNFSNRRIILSIFLRLV